MLNSAEISLLASRATTLDCHDFGIDVPLRFSLSVPNARNRLDCEQSTPESHRRASDLVITLERPRQYFPPGYAICRKPFLIIRDRL